VLLTIVYGMLVIGGICLAALAGLELVQHLVPADSRQRHNATLQASSTQRWA
jgi:hypothetical protein